MELFSSTTSSSVLYCCNQATVHNYGNYAMKKASSINSVVELLNAIVDDKQEKCTYEKLLSCFQELSEASLLQQLARSVIKKSSVYDMSQPQVVHVGNKPTRQREPLDYSSMPQVVSCVSDNQMVGSFRIFRNFQYSYCSQAAFVVAYLHAWTGTVHEILSLFTMKY